MTSNPEDASWVSMDPAAVKAIAGAIDAALKSEDMQKIVRNAVKGQPHNLGPNGTKKMLVDGIDNVKVLFGK